MNRVHCALQWSRDLAHWEAVENLTDFIPLNATGFDSHLCYASAAPMIMAALEQLAGRAGKPRSLPLQVVVTSAVLVAAIPLASSLSPAIGTIAIEEVEPTVKAAVLSKHPEARVLQYVRGF